MEKKIGVVGVDSGCILIGDPCYWLNDKQYQKEVCTPKWSLFRNLPYDTGHMGKGVIISTGYGDGMYPISIENEDNRIKSVTIKFF